MQAQPTQKQYIEYQEVLAVDSADAALLNQAKTLIMTFLRNSDDVTGGGDTASHDTLTLLARAKKEVNRVLEHIRDPLLRNITFEDLLGLIHREMVFTFPVNHS